MQTMEKIKELQKEFVEEYPIMNRRVWIWHFCKFFWISRQSLYLKEPEKNSKRKKIDWKKWNSKKFMKFLLDNTK